MAVIPILLIASSLRPSAHTRNAPGLIDSCAALQPPSSWHSCAERNTDVRGDALLRLRLRAHAALARAPGRRALLFGDSMVRQLYVLLMCLLVPDATAHPRLGWARKDWGRHPLFSMCTRQGAVLQFKFALDARHGNPYAPLLWPKLRAAIAASDVVLVNWGAHCGQPEDCREQFEAHVKLTQAAASRTTRLVVLEYAAVHFRTRSGQGDYREAVELWSNYSAPLPYLNGSEAHDHRCCPPLAPDAPVNPRAIVSRAISQLHALPIVEAYNASAAESALHPDGLRECHHITFRVPRVLGLPGKRWNLE